MLINGCSKNKLPPTKIRIGINAWPGYELLYLASVKGYYKELGIDVTIIEFQALADARRAFEKGQVDVLATTVIDQLISRVQSNKFAQVFIVTDYSAGADVILSNKKYTKLKDLKGKKVGVELGSVTVYELSRALELEGLKLKDVEIISLDQNQLVADLKNNKIDAAVTYPPFSINANKKSEFNILFDSRKIPGELVDVVVADQKFIKENPEIVKNIKLAYRKAYFYAMEKNNDAFEIMSKREGISKVEFIDAISNGVVLLNPDLVDQEFLVNGKLQDVANRVERVLIETKQIPNKAIANNIYEKNL
jgi:NitT/TauT family transport system substrate-binding protein